MFIWLKLNIYLRVFLVAFFASLLGTPIIRYLATKLKVLDYPNTWKSHSTPVPRWGGLAIYGAYTLAVVSTLWYSNSLKGIIIGGFIVLFVGMLDDALGGIPATVKFLILVIVSLFIATKYGVVVKITQNFYLDCFLTVLWITGITSAFNAIDNTDGLASGIALVATLFYFIIASLTRQWWLGMLSIALAGANLGFLKYNFNKASIFMGDSGSFFLGFTVASVGVMGEWAENVFISCLVPILILGVPIFDMSFIVIRRRLVGITHNMKEDLTHSDKDHFSHQLMKIGFNKLKTVFFIYSIAVILGELALLTKIIDNVLFASSVFILILIIALLGAKRLSEAG